MIKQLIKIEDGKLKPTSDQLDADLIEVSKVEGNALEIKEDGLYYKEKASDYSLYHSQEVKLSPKTFITITNADGDGKWSVDYSHVGFTAPPVVVATGVIVGSALGDRRFASINTPTVDGVSGILLSSSSAGLLAAMTMVTASGSVHIIAMGY